MFTDKQQQQFLIWFDNHLPLIVRAAKTYAADREDQDDLVQEILLQLWSSIPRFRGDAAETTWIYRVALNTALAWTRGQTRRRKRLKITLRETCQLPSTADEAIEDDVIAQLYDAIRQLPPADRSVVLMQLEGLSYDDMADVLGLTRNHVGVRLTRAKKKLAASLKGLIDDL